MVSTRADTRSGPLRWVAAAAAALALVLVPPASAPSAQPAEAAAQTSLEAEFAAVKAAAAASRRALQPLDHALEAIAARDRQSAGAEPDRARAALRRHEAALGRFEAFAALVRTASDAGHEIAGLPAELPPEDLDAVAAALASAAGPDRDGAAALADYREALQTLLAAAGPLRARLLAQREQDRLAGPARGGEDDQRYRQLVAQYGETLAGASVYVRSSPPELYRPRVPPPEKVFDVALLWQEQDREWHRLTADVPVEEIFRDVFIATGKRPTPGQLKYLAGIHGQIGVRRATVDAIAEFLQAAATGQTPPAQAFARAAEGEGMRAALAEPWRLRARYVYDGAYRTWVLAVVDQVRQDLVKQGSGALGALQALDDMLDRYGLTLDSQWAVAVPPAVADVKVTAWFADDPKTRFTSTWRFEREQVRIEIEQGRATGLRRANTVQTEGSIPGRNCTATDVRSFAPDGTLTFSASYRCVRDDGTLEVNNRIGAGTWEVIGDPKPAQRPPASRRPR